MTPLERIAAVARKHGIEGPVTRPTDGDLHHRFVGDEHIVKLMDPRWRFQLEADRAVLEAIAGEHAAGVGSPELRVPRVIAHGDIDDWPYLILERICGAPASELWGDIPHDRQTRILWDIGRALAAIHRMTPPQALDANWDAFLDDRAAKATAHHTSKGARRELTRDIDALIASVHVSLRTSAPVVLHGDLTSGNVMLTSDAGGWRMTAIIDFGDARLGHPLYDLSTPALFLARGDRALLASLLAGYGATPTDDLARTLLACSLLHPFGDLVRDATMAGAADAKTLDQLLARVWRV